MDVWTPGLQRNTTMVYGTGCLFVYLFLTGCFPFAEQQSPGQVTNPPPTVAAFFNRENLVTIDRARILSEAAVPMRENELPPFMVYNPLDESGENSVVSPTSAANIPGVAGSNPEGAGMPSRLNPVASTDSSSVSTESQRQGGAENRMGQEAASTNADLKQTSGIELSLVDNSGREADGAIGSDAHAMGGSAGDAPALILSDSPTAPLASSSSSGVLPAISSNDISYDVMSEISDAEDFTQGTMLSETSGVDLLVAETDDRTSDRQEHPRAVAGLTQYDAPAGDGQRTNMAVTDELLPTPSSALGQIRESRLYYSAANGVPQSRIYTTHIGVFLFCVLCGWFLLIWK